MSTSFLDVLGHLRRKKNALASDIIKNRFVDHVYL